MPGGAKHNWVAAKELKLGVILGVPIIRIIVFGGLYWGPLLLGNYQLSYQNNGYVYIYIYCICIHCNLHGLPKIVT